VREANPSWTRKIRNSQKPGSAGGNRMQGALRLNNWRSLFCARSERDTNDNVARAFAPSAGYDDPMGGANPERGHRRWNIRGAVDSNQPFATLDSGNVCRTVLEYVQEIPVLLAVSFKGSDRGIYRVLRQETVCSLMVEDCVAATEFGECL